jgi:hypothetical protein
MEDVMNQLMTNIYIHTFIYKRLPTQYLTGFFHYTRQTLKCLSQYTMSSHRWKNIRVHLQEIAQWQAAVNMVMNLWVPQNVMNFSIRTVTINQLTKDSAPDN